jgi:hypothetical protein
LTGRDRDVAVIAAARGEALSAYKPPRHPMTYFHPAWLEHQRRRFTRPDAWRLAPRGTPEAKPPGWLDPSMTRVRWKEAQEKEARAQAEVAQEEFERDVLELRHDLAKLKLEYELRRFQHKYSPNQPRVPAGSPQGGQWTSGVAAVGAAAAGDSGSDGIADAGDAAAADSGGGMPDGVDADGGSLAQELRRFPASDQPPRSDRQQLEAIANDPLIRAYMDEAWVASNPYGIFPKEHGFWISRDEVSGQLFTRPFESPGYENRINPGPPPPDAIAFFHTHPFGGIQIGVAGPSFQDETWATRLGLPGLIQSHVGVYYFGPLLRTAR